MYYHVYADLSRTLTVEERHSLFERLDAIVPDSGCVGRDKRPNDEVYFCVETATEDKARAQAASYMTATLQRAGLDIDYTIEVRL
jgi:hypothetical protein